MIIKVAMFWGFMFMNGIGVVIPGNGAALFTLFRVFHKLAEPGDYRRKRECFLKPGYDKQEGT
jgi:hypothetical protein